MIRSNEFLYAKARHKAGQNILCRSVKMSSRDSVAQADDAPVQAAESSHQASRTAGSRGTSTTTDVSIDLTINGSENFSRDVLAAAILENPAILDILRDDNAMKDTMDTALDQMAAAIEEQIRKKREARLDRYLEHLHSKVQEVVDAYNTLALENGRPPYRSKQEPEPKLVSEPYTYFFPGGLHEQLNPKKFSPEMEESILRALMMDAMKVLEGRDSQEDRIGLLYSWMKSELQLSEWWKLDPETKLLGFEGPARDGPRGIKPDQ